MREDIERYNEWWFTGKVRRELAPEYRRRDYAKLLKALQNRQIVIITGLRRVGKSTLMYQAIDHLLETTPPQQILYFSFDEEKHDPKQILKIYEREVLKKPFEEAGKIYVFFDEIQNVDGWTAAVKQFYDLYPSVKFVLSGSSTLLLSVEAVHKLAGRFTTLKVKPLTFVEFLELKKIKPERIMDFPRHAQTLFSEYLTKSGFPQVAAWDSEDMVAEYVRNSVGERIMFRDIPSVFGTKSISLIKDMFKLVVLNPGLVINLNNLAKDLQSTRVTVSNYLRYFETTLAIKALSNYRPSTLASSRKLKKYYPATTSLTYAYDKNSFYEKFGGVLETYVVSALDAQYYFREDGREVDVVLVDDGLVLVEVKESVASEDFSRLGKLVSLLKARKAVIISMEEQKARENVQAVPVYCLELSSVG